MCFGILVLISKENSNASEVVQDFPCISLSATLALGASERLRLQDCTCFVFELEFLAGNAPSRQFSCWVKPAIPFGFVEHIAKSMFAHPGSGTCEG